MLRESTRLERLSKLKHLRYEDERKLNNLLKIGEYLTSLTDANIRLDQLYNRVIENLQNCTPELKRLALNALGIRVYASTDKVAIQGVIPLELPTIEQTLGFLIKMSYTDWQRGNTNNTSVQSNEDK